MKKESNKKIHKVRFYKRGFSLIEVLFSLTILTLGIATVSMVVASNIRNAQSAKDQIIATSLAQEGIELVRNIKDGGTTNLVATWPEIMGMMTQSDTVYDNCRIDSQYWIGDFVWVNSHASMQLYLDDSGFYTHKSTNGTPTKYFRKITFQRDSNNKVTVNSYVVWNGTGVFPPECTLVNKCISLSSIMPASN